MLGIFITNGIAWILGSVIVHLCMKQQDWVYVQHVVINTIFVLSLLYYRLREEGYKK